MNKISQSKVLNKNVLIFDVSNMQYRCLLSNYKPLDTEFKNFKTKFLKDIFYSIMEYSPDIVIMAMDSKHLWRREIFSEYKTHRQAARKASPVDFDKFFAMVRPFYAKLSTELFKNFMWLDVDAVEADDTIAVLTKSRLRAAKSVTVISTDGDMSQLLKYSNYRQYSPMKRDFFQVIDPVKMLEIKIIAGDRGDNIPGIIPRCAEKTAEKIYNSGGLEALLVNEDVKAAYIRNRKLIDFEMIPENVSTKILNSFDEYEINKFDFSKLFNYILAEDLSSDMDGMFMDQRVMSKIGKVGL